MDLLLSVLLEQHKTMMSNPAWFLGVSGEQFHLKRWARWGRGPFPMKVRIIPHVKAWVEENFSLLLFHYLFALGSVCPVIISCPWTQNTPWTFLDLHNNVCACVYACVFVHVSDCTFLHTHTHTHSFHCKRLKTFRSWLKTLKYRWGRCPWDEHAWSWRSRPFSILSPFLLQISLWEIMLMFLHSNNFSVIWTTYDFKMTSLYYFWTPH